ncbi:hypothetical protein CJ030_MR3G014838 [Morella rubra]|uniref:S-protein homolog n=1 Tax=Morella rubra TaxID=262757 RepID=A0A6A1VXQ3_9ROSI|nr:hypothetical protein CJ030_MR3G014838 [Morella rubra]
MSPMRQYFVYYVLIVLVAALPLGNSTGNSPSPTSSDPEMETPPLQVPHGTYYVQEHHWSIEVDGKGPSFECYLQSTKGHSTFEPLPAPMLFIPNYCGDKQCVWKAEEDGIGLLNKNSGKYEQVYD